MLAENSLAALGLRVFVPETPLSPRGMLGLRVVGLVVIVARLAVDTEEEEGEKEEKEEDLNWIDPDDDAIRRLAASNSR